VEPAATAGGSDPEKHPANNATIGTASKPMPRENREFMIATYREQYEFGRITNSAMTISIVPRALPVSRLLTGK
jgi:hypothetical protein